MPLMVIEASAMLVANTTFLVPLGVLWNTLIWCSAGKLPCIGRTKSFSYREDNSLAASLYQEYNTKTFQFKEQLWVSMEHHKWVSIIALPHSEACFSFFIARIDVGCGMIGCTEREGAMAKAPTQVHTIASPVLNQLFGYLSAYLTSWVEWPMY